MTQRTVAPIAIISASANPKVFSSLPASVTLSAGCFVDVSELRSTVFPALSLRNFCTFALTQQSALLHYVLLCFSRSGPLVAPLPTGCVKLFDARRCQVCIFLVFPILKQKQPPLHQPEGMCANSSPVGSIAITEPPPPHPRNCKGSCFPSDRPSTKEKGPITPGSTD